MTKDPPQTLPYAHPEMIHGHESVSRSEMSNFSQDQGFREPAAKQWACATAKRCEEIKGLFGGVRRYVAQIIPKIDEEIAEKSHFWMETS